MIDSPSGGAPEKAPRWDHMGTEGCGGGNRVSWCSRMFSGYMSIYRRKKLVRGATSGPQGWGHAYHSWAWPPPLWAPRSSTDLLLPPIYTYVPPNDQIWSQNPNSTAATFCTREIPSWGLFWRSAGGGIDHGGLLHQHHSLSDDV